MMKFKLSYKDKIYIVEDDYPRENQNEIPYIWEEGNYSCDCNKSIFIQRDCDENFPEMSCGDEIKLLGICE